MAVVDVINTRGEKVSQMDLKEEIFEIEVKPSILHDVVTMQLAARRAGTASVKRRSDVKGSNRKLFRQKGTGRARRGNIKSPLLRGGGVAFGPSPRQYGAKLSKKVRRLALKMALTSKLQENELKVVDRIDMEHIKTADFVSITQAIDVDQALIIIAEQDEKLALSSRNVPGMTVMTTAGLNVYDILRHRNLVLTEASVQGIEGRLAS
jgi:large subunit ribosomal protein L4